MCKYVIEEEIDIIHTAFISLKHDEITQCAVITDDTLLYVTDSAFREQV